MKVELVKTLMDQIIAVKREALRANREINYITLTKDEAKRLHREIKGASIPWGYRSLHASYVHEVKIYVDRTA